MIGGLIKCLTAFTILLPLVSQAAADRLTRYEHYLLIGDTPQRLFESLIKNGPRVARGRVYALTRMDPQIEVHTERTGDQCRADLKINMSFTIRLPQIEPSQMVVASLRQSFDHFYAFAKRHEENHRAIWLRCAAEAESLASDVTAATCIDAELRAFRILTEVSARCDRRHAEFDAAEQSILHKHPFLRQLYSKHLPEIRQSGP
jgi:predicted secreted Zn-dependent protease